MKAHTLALLLGCLLLILSGPGANQAYAQQADLDNQVRLKLAAATPLTLPSMAAKLVAEAAPKDRTATAVAAVRYALAVRPNVAMVVLRAVVAAAPKQGGDIAAALLKLEPKRFRDIVAAAAAAAPAQATQLVSVLCREQPLRFAEIAAIVAKQVPETSPQLLAAVSDSLAGTKPILARATSRGRNVGKHDVQFVVSTTTLTLQMINAAAQLIAQTINDPGSYQNAVIAILQGNIVVQGDGQLGTINVDALPASNLKTQLSSPTTRQNVIDTVYNEAVVNTGSSYHGTVVAAGNAPATVIQPGDTVIVEDTKVRPYSQ